MYVNTSEPTTVVQWLSFVSLRKLGTIFSISSLLACTTISTTHTTVRKHQRDGRMYTGAAALRRWG